MPIKGRRNRDVPRGRYVTLREYMLETPAWQSLDCVARSLYVEIARRYRGPNSNNGKIPYSVREAATALGISKDTANRAFLDLQDRGFAKVAKGSGFNIKGRVSREWSLTEFSDDRAGKHVEPTKEFMRWQPPNAASKRPAREIVELSKFKPAIVAQRVA
jgi:DNA-binding GntR family transcriptional regulator